MYKYIYIYTFFKDWVLFETYGDYTVHNFVCLGFFSWYMEEWFEMIRKHIRKIIVQLDPRATGLGGAVAQILMQDGTRWAPTIHSYKWSYTPYMWPLYMGNWGSFTTTNSKWSSFTVLYIRFFSGAHLVGRVNIGPFVVKVITVMYIYEWSLYIYQSFCFK